MDGISTRQHHEVLGNVGVVRVAGPFTRICEAWRAARVVVDGVTAGEPSLAIIGDFVIPPAGGPPSRDFQTLHFDFGLPLVPFVPADVARFTALHIPAEMPASDAFTRLVPLRPLLAGRPWPDLDELVQRLTAYGRTHGARDDAVGYTEGSLARMIEAALGGSPVLPNVKTAHEFLCGMEFSSVVDELEFFTQRGFRVEAVQLEVRLLPGELLIFDNLVLAHGRRGIRRPGELHQRIFGHPLLPVGALAQLRDRVLTAFRRPVVPTFPAARALRVRRGPDRDDCRGMKLGLPARSRAPRVAAVDLRSSSSARRRALLGKSLDDEPMRVP